VARRPDRRVLATLRMARTTAAHVLEAGDQLLPLSLPQHPDEHRSEHPVLLTVDQQLGEGAALRVAQNWPIRSVRSKSGSIRTCSSSARGAGPKA
jgi:hypothetical protein